MIRENIAISLRNIWNNKFKSFLTVLGIVIGVTAIITLISVVQGVTLSVKKSVYQLGANRITISITSGNGYKTGLFEEEINEIAEMENVAGVSPLFAVGGLTLVNSETNASMTGCSLYGRGKAFADNIPQLMQSGSFFTLNDELNENYVCVIGHDIATTIFFGTDCVGKEIIVGGVAYTVMGIMNETGEFAMYSYNRMVVAPYTTVMKQYSRTQVTSAEVFLKDETLATTTMYALKSKVSSMFSGSESGFTINNSQEALDFLNNMIDIMTVALVCIAGISLLVGGIGIMNMMLVTVRERTVEIGLRKALGATPRHIRQQFLIEAVVLCFLGALLGMICGVLLTIGFCTLIGCVLVINPYTIIVAVLFSALIGVVFGFAPAFKASKLSPIEALRAV